MFDNTIIIQKLKKIRDEKLYEIEQLPQVGVLESKSKILIEHDYEKIIRNLYDVELRSYFKFNISDAIFEEYDNLLDDYIDMNELNYEAMELQAMEIQIEIFSNKYSN